MLSLFTAWAHADIPPPPKPSEPHSIVQETVNGIQRQNPYLTEDSNLNCHPDAFPKEHEYGPPIHPSRPNTRTIISTTSYVHCAVCEGSAKDPHACARKYTPPKWWFECRTDMKAYLETVIEGKGSFSRDHRWEEVWCTNNQDVQPIESLKSNIAGCARSASVSGLFVLFTWVGFSWKRRRKSTREVAEIQRLAK